MEEKLNALLQNCKSYLQTFQEEEKGNGISEKQNAYYLALKKLYPLLQKAVQEKGTAPKENTVAAFNDLYNKNFAYLHKFTSVSQNSIPHILKYQQLVQKMDKLYQGIPKKTLERQAQILKGRRKDIDKWLKAFEQLLQSKENQQALEKRFLELLDQANQTLAEKGLAAISISIDNTPTV